MKHKVGDKVRVRKDLEVGKEYGGCRYMNTMRSFLETEQTISEICDMDDCYEFESDTNEDKFGFTDEMLEDQP